MLLLPSFPLGATVSAASSPPQSPIVQTTVIAPGLIFVLAIAGAVGVILLLPGTMQAPFRKMGAAVLLAVAVVFAALLAKTAAGMNAYFWIFSAIAVVCALRVITHPKPVYSALYFVMTVMASAGLFVLMWAEFMAAALVIIYAGAILVTYVFVIMLASQATPAGASSMHQQLAEHDAVSREPIIASAVGFALLGVLLFVIFDRAPVTNPFPGTFANGAFYFGDTQKGSVDPTPGFVPVGATQKLGAYLFDKQLVNLELAGLLLTVAMVGAIVIARERVVGGTALESGTPEILTGPATPVDDNPHSIPVVGTENPRQKEYPET